MTHIKKWRASTRAHDPFLDNLKIWPTFIYRGEVPSNTFAKLPVCVLINDPKKMFKKKLYVTIPQWFETFPNMSDLWPGRNRAKCGLQLNDPIDWLKLRLSQPKNFLARNKCTPRDACGSIFPNLNSKHGIPKATISHAHMHEIHSIQPLISLYGGFKTNRYFHKSEPIFHVTNFQNIFFTNTETLEGLSIQKWSNFKYMGIIFQTK